MARLDYYFRETATGLRRNPVVAFAAVVTAFIALFLFGLALLITREFNLVIEAWTGNVQVAVYLNDPAKPDTVVHIQDKLTGLAAVDSVEFWDKTKTCTQFEQLFANQPTFTENVDCEKVIPTSLRVKLSDPALYDQVTAALACEPNDQNQIVCAEAGVKNVADYRQVLNRLNAITSVLKIVLGALAVVMLIFAIVLVANTLRMGMFARRREIGVMRLVGATNWRIRVPFLIEGLVEALAGAGLAILSLFLVKVWGIDSLRGDIAFVPLVKNSDLLVIVPWILIAATFVAIIAGTFGMRRFLDV
jgi:cell division transport system permease protein